MNNKKDTITLFDIDKDGKYVITDKKRQLKREEVRIIKSNELPPPSAYLFLFSKYDDGVELDKILDKFRAMDKVPKTIVSRGKHGIKHTTTREDFLDVLNRGACFAFALRWLHCITSTTYMSAQGRLDIVRQSTMIDCHMQSLYQRSDFSHMPEDSDYSGYRGPVDIRILAHPVFREVYRLESYAACSNYINNLDLIYKQFESDKTDLSMMLRFVNTINNGMRYGHAMVIRMVYNRIYIFESNRGEYQCKKRDFRYAFGELITSGFFFNFSDVEISWIRVV